VHQNIVWQPGTAQTRWERGGGSSIPPDFLAVVGGRGGNKGREGTAEGEEGGKERRKRGAAHPLKFSKVGACAASCRSRGTS